MSENIEAVAEEVSEGIVKPIAATIGDEAVPTAKEFNEQMLPVARKLASEVEPQAEKLAAALGDLADGLPNSIRRAVRFDLATELL